MQHPPTKRKAMTNKRTIILTSDCGNYTISASLIADSDCYTQDNGTGMKCYKGSHWVVSMKCQGKPVNHIKGFHFGKYACGLCQYDTPLNKNTVLYLAHLSGIFTKALSVIDCKKVERTYLNEYVKAKIANDKTLYQ
jgi:hypothetical protein